MTGNLFASNEPLPLHLPDADVTLFPGFLTEGEGARLFEALKQEIHWQQEQVRVYGKVHMTPRLTAWYGEPHKIYTYSGLSVETTPWSPSLLGLKAKIEACVQHRFNSVLLNLYRNGGDGVSWHSDDEPELGQQPVIASLSLGETRSFQMKHKTLKDEKRTILLEHGALLLMQGQTQHYWLHQIPKSAKALQERINLTFRVIR